MSRLPTTPLQGLNRPPRIVTPSTYTKRPMTTSTPISSGRKPLPMPSGTRTSRLRAATSQTNLTDLSNRSPRAGGATFINSRTVTQVAGAPTAGASIVNRRPPVETTGPSVRLVRQRNPLPVPMPTRTSRLRSKVNAGVSDNPLSIRTAPSLPSQRKPSAVSVTRPMAASSRTSISSAMDAVKRRQEEARLKHEAMRSRALALAAAQQSMRQPPRHAATPRQLGRSEAPIKPTRMMQPKVPKRHLTKPSRDVLDAMMPKLVQKGQKTTKCEDLNPEDVAHLMHISEVTHTAVGGSPATFASVFFPAAETVPGPSASKLRVQAPTSRLPKAAIDQVLDKDAEGETEEQRKQRLDKLQQRAKDLFEEISGKRPPIIIPGDQMLDESKTLNEEFIANLDVSHAPKYTAKPPRAENKAQLRGSHIPSWFPGYCVLHPNLNLPRLEITKTFRPTSLNAWKILEPEQGN